MEFPDLGRQCDLAECKQLDFLPFDCYLCSKVFCKDHVGYEQHNCTELYKKDKRIPVCPLCNYPISISPGETPDHRVNEHIENDCKSDLAFKRRKTYSNRCSVKGCKRRELVPVTCAMCVKNFCLRHRHENDHDCISLNAALSSSSKRDQRRQNFKENPSSQFQKTKFQRNQGGMTEDEALAFALQESLADVTRREGEGEGDGNSDIPYDVEEDLALARAIAQSEEDETNRQKQVPQARSSKDSGCNIS